MNINIRQETEADFKTVFELTAQAFKNLEVSDHTEQFLVEHLRLSKNFIPELSLVAELNGIIAGHIMLTKIYINNESGQSETLILAPVSVLPEYQSRGIGSKLIMHAHLKAKELGYNSVILVGHPDYYPRFGYKKLSGFGIKVPFDVPDECCLGVELVEGALSDKSGIVEFPPEFTAGSSDNIRPE